MVESATLAEPPAVTNIAQWVALPVGESAKAVALQIDATVLCYDAGWGQFYVNDGRGTLYLSPQTFHRELQRGQVVRIMGTTTALNQEKGLTNLTLTIVGSSPLPPPRRLAVAELHRLRGDWVECEGQVRSADTSLGRLALIIRDRGQNCLVHVMGPPQAHDIERLLYATVRVRGINGSTASNGHLDSALLFAPSLEDVIVLEPPDPQIHNAAVLSIGSLLDRELGPWTNQPVRIHGSVVSHVPGKWLTVEDPTGIIRTRIVQASEIQAGHRVDVRGFLGFSDGEVILDDAVFERENPTQVVPAAGRASDPSATDAPRRDVVLATFPEVLKLTRAEASQNYLVRLRGVITYADAEWRVGFMQAGDQAIFIDLGDKDVRAGDWVEVQGETEFSGFAPQVIHSSVRALGTTNLPVAIRVELQDLANGHLDAHWIEMEGVVRRVSSQWNRVTLDVETGKGKFQATIPHVDDASTPTNLVDAVVRVRGACSSRLNARGQLRGISLNSPGLESIEILQPVPNNPFAAPPTPIGAVATFDPERTDGRRIRIAGTVTLVLPGRGFYLQDVSGGIRVITVDGSAVQVGDHVDVLGFPYLGDFSPYLQEPTLRVTQKGSLPQPRRTTASAILLEGSQDGLRVQLEAHLLQDVPHSASPQLLLQDGPIVFTARQEKAVGPSTLCALKAGSRVRITGVCSVQGGPDREPRSFRLLVDSPSDVTLLTAPPIWTVQRIVWVSVALIAVLLLALAWVGSLRREVHARTRQLREESDRHRQTASQLQVEMQKREEMEREVEKKHKELLVSSRHAGMAEVATGVLHNVGNVLNSVNVSANLIMEQARRMPVGNVGRVAELLQQQGTELGVFMTKDPRGRQIPEYLVKLDSQLDGQRRAVIDEIQQLLGRIDHIKEIVAMQQDFATHAGLSERTSVADLIDEAVRMNNASFQRYGIQVTSQVDPKLPDVIIDKHKAMQILINLLRNAKQACSEADRQEKYIRVCAFPNDGALQITVSDNGVGIAPENLTRIFAHGFTTRQKGHGFGLHSSALAAREMRGSLRASSNGPGEGALFTLQLPLEEIATQKAAAVGQTA